MKHKSSPFNNAIQVQPCKIRIPQMKNSYKVYKYKMRGNARNFIDKNMYYYCNLTSKLVAQNNYSLNSIPFINIRNPPKFHLHDLHL